MTITLDKPAPTLERRGSDWERHEGHGGPKVLPPPGVEWRSASGKTVQRHRYYTRVTTLAKAIDDTSKLMAWKMRGVLVGLGQRPDYQVAAAALTLSAEDRKAADELADKALQAARGDGAALVGTALHTFTERLDRGEDLGHVPAQLVPLVEAYRVLTEPLTFHHREVRMICDDLEVAGTPDAIGTCSIPDPDGVVDGLRIIDLKSGKVAYPGPMSIQLATYGRSDLYDPATGARTPLPDVNQRWGLIVHVQQDGEVPPGLYWINLQHGNEGIELCRQVRAWRKVKPQQILLPVAEVTPADAAADLVVDDTVIVAQDEDTEPQPATLDGVVTVEAVRHPSGRLEALEPQEDDEAAADGTDATDEWDAAQAIVSAVTTRDLDVLWQQHGVTWSPELVALAIERHGELREAEALQRPRAALAAALQVASGLELRALWLEHGATPVWTPQHDELARARHEQLSEWP